jgi:hypothetical protein
MTRLVDFDKISQVATDQISLLPPVYPARGRDFVQWQRGYDFMQDTDVLVHLALF